ncbi:MAG: hypothetical protein KAU31_02760, partial [Spirochaetaceae bacterium]|nr:hypothetical protein [Spirochaetaceae bacterium]
MSGRRMTRRAGEARKTPPARALLPAVAAVIVVLAALALAGCDDMDLLGLVRLRVTGASGIVIYVSPAGSDENNGLLPELAVAAIHTGMDRAEEHGASEVRVAEGTYVVDGYEDEIDMRSGVALKGGYSNDFTTWDPENHESIILADSPNGFICAQGPEVQDASIEGFSVDTATDAYGTMFGVINIVSGASLSVLNNKFRVHLSGNSFYQ